MNSNNNQKIDMLLGKLEPETVMPRFETVWEKFISAGGMPKPFPSFDYKPFFKLFPVSFLAALIVAVIMIGLFSLKPFEKEGEWVNQTTGFSKLNWKGHIVAVSPGTHWKMKYPNLANRSTVIYLYSGKILCHPKKLKNDEKFVVVLSDAEVNVKGTIFSVNADGISRRVTVTEGKVWVHLNGSKSTNVLEEGQTMEWKSSVIQPNRNTDGEDLSEIIRELGMNSGRIKTWSVRIKNESGFQIMKDENGSVWFISGTELWKLDGNTGAKKIFQQFTGSQLTYLTASSGRLLLGSADGGLLSIRDDGQDPQKIMDPPSFRRYAPPIYSGNYIAYPTLDANIWYYDIRKNRRGTIVAPEGDTVFSTPMVENDLLCFVTGSGKLEVYDLATDQFMATNFIFRERLVFPILRSGTSLLVFDRKNGRIAYLNKENFKIESVVQRSELSGIDQYPLVMEDQVLWHDPNDKYGRVFASKIRNQIAECDLFTSVGTNISGIVIGQDRVYISSADRKLKVYSYNGNLLFQRNLPGRVIGSDQNGIYMKDGQLVEYCFMDKL